jgi:hypothetical protein
MDDPLPKVAANLPPPAHDRSAVNSFPHQNVELCTLEGDRGDGVIGSSEAASDLIWQIWSLKGSCWV